MHAWFLKITFVPNVGMQACMSSPPRLLITTGMIGMIWTPYDWLNKFYSFCMAAVVRIVSSHGLTIEMRHRNQPNKSKLCSIVHAVIFILTVV